MPVPIVMFLHALPAILATALAGVVLWNIVKLGKRAFGKLAHN